MTQVYFHCSNAKEVLIDRPTANRARTFRDCELPHIAHEAFVVK